jgi:tetratricopeptide (TPR) repeat protein
VSVDLYERYKDALRRGHAAIARGQLDDAMAAYREAMSLAPDRALPHVGVGQVLLRQGSAAEALASFDAALVRSPRDEGGLRGRSQALARLGRRTDAAEVLDILSEAQEAAGRLADACDTTRRALDLAEQKARRRRLQDLTRRLRLQAGDRDHEVALARSLRPLAASDGAGRDPGTEPLEPGAVDAQAGASNWAAAGLAADAGRPVEASSGIGSADATMAGDGGSIPDEAAGAAATSTEAPGVEGQPPADESARVAEAAPADGVAPPPPEPRPDPGVLVWAAEAALDAGDTVAARLAYLDAAAAFQAEGLLAAALDACSAVLAFAPDDAAVHLRLVELYLEQGWNGPAADKLALLGRLTELDDRQGSARARIVVLAADHVPDDPRLRRLSSHRVARR